MLLLNLSEWNSAERIKMGVQTAQVGYVTNLSLPEAIEIISEFESAFNRYYSIAVNFSLLSVSEIGHLSNNHRDMARLPLMEDLKNETIELNELSVAREDKELLKMCDLEFNYKDNNVNLG